MSELDRVEATGTPAEIAAAARVALTIFKKQDLGFLFGITAHKSIPKPRLVIVSSNPVASTWTPGGIEVVRPEEVRPKGIDLAANPLYIWLAPVEKDIPPGADPYHFTLHRLSEGGGSPLWITFHKLPGERRSQFLVEVENPGLQDHGLADYWRRLKAELARQGWLGEPEEEAKDPPHPRSGDRLSRGIKKAQEELRAEGIPDTDEAIAGWLARNNIVSPKTGEMYSREWICKKRKEQEPDDVEPQ